MENTKGHTFCENKYQGHIFHFPQSIQIHMLNKSQRDETNILLENKMSCWRRKTPFKVNIYSVVSYWRMAYYCLYKNMAASYKLLGLDIEG